jgi:GNAT superfamily N-acetyltransferase
MKPVVFEVVDSQSADARVAIEQYFAELDERFSDGFDPDAGGAAHDVEHLSAPTGAFVVARCDALVVGCGGVQQVDVDTAEIKRMWVLADERGHGLGRRLLGHLEGVARSLGYRRVVLDTNESLTEAITMYAKAGYRTIDRYNDNPYAHHWFAKDL